jgi:hypothetical protein
MGRNRKSTINRLSPAARHEHNLRIPTKPAMHSNLKPARYSNAKPAGIPI